MILDSEMEEIAAIFFEESFEGLSTMEAGLLTLAENPDSETINKIFRAAHSIKGGAGTFGFMEISQFTHSVETLLDEMRNGTRAATPDAVNAALESVDVIRKMLESSQAKTPIDMTNANELAERLARVLSSKEAVGSASSDPAAGAAPPTVPQATPAESAGVVPNLIGWRIDFIPDLSLFKTCNDPIRILGQLERLAALDVTAVLADLPAFAEMDPTLCYLSWTLNLRGPVPKDQIVEVFDWVDTVSRIEYMPVTEEPLAALPEPDPHPAALGPQAPPLKTEAAANAMVPAAATPDPTAIAAVPNAGSASPAKTNAEGGSIRVATEKVDALINLVGELVIAQSMLGTLSDSPERGEIDILRRGLVQLARHTRELQDRVMQIRMLPIGFTFNRFPRLVHDLSRKLGKKVELRLSGENTEVDKTVLEKISDPLTHLVRNSLDHGLESPERRLASGKTETGLLELKAYHQGGSIIIEVNDDGAGLNKTKILAKGRERGLVKATEELSDEQIHNLIFAAGFSTADAVSDLSGRGVGMDVVRRNINDLGGQVQIVSVEGQGSTIRIRLPLTLAILDGQVLRVGNEIYVVSLISIIETVQPTREHLSSIAEQTELLLHRGAYIPIIRLHELFDIEPDSREIARGLLVVVEADGVRAAILVDELLAHQQVVIKSLDANFRQVRGLAGATIHGDGTVALILDVRGVIMAFNERHAGRLEFAA